MITFQRFSKTKFTVTLSGGRVYNFSVGDITKLMCWTRGTEVELSENEDDDVYPILITRVDVGDEVRARDPSSPSGLPEDLEEP